MIHTFGSTIKLHGDMNMTTKSTLNLDKIAIWDLLNCVKNVYMGSLKLGEALAFLTFHSNQQSK